MASSQIEMASSPYTRVLRDHNRRVRGRENNSQAQSDFQKNFKELVRDHLHTCIILSAPGDSQAASNENSQHRIHNQNCWDARDQERNFRVVSSNSREEMIESSAVRRRRRSRILDRWAARQAREMITTIERQAHEAELLALSNSHTVSTRASTFLRETSPAQSDSSVDLPNLRASSLVQMWREFEAEAETPRNSNSNSNSAFTGSRNNSTFRNIENVSIKEPSMGSDFCDSTNERYEALAVPEDSFADWESERTATSEQVSSPQGQVSDVGESTERVRVVDMVRRLASGSINHAPITSWSDEIEREQPTTTESSSSLDHSVSDQGERRDLPFIGNPPLVRGRQAIMDLFTQMKREKQRELSRLGERHAVSRFSQRGHIQSLLRIRFLQREVAVQDQRRPATTTSELDQLQQQTTFFLLRERFSPRIDREDREVLSGEDDSRSHTRLHNNTSYSEHSSGLSNEPTVHDTHHQAVATFEHNTLPAHHSMLSTGAHPQEAAGQGSDSTLPQTDLGSGNLDLQGPVDNATTSFLEDATTEKTEPDTRRHVRSIDDWERVIVTEEPDPDTLHLVEPTNGNWLSDDSPPQRRDREDRRQAWYYDTLENNSDNEEIRDLLERRSVSNFLASGFRGRMERLILSYLRRQRHQAIVESAEEEEEENHIEHQYQEVSDDSDQVAFPSLQLPLPSRLRSWTQYQDQEVSDDPDQVASTSLQLPQPTQSYYQDRRPCSPFINRPSLEMELIYDLRGHMASIHHEMSELRKSIESCMGMQMKLQKSIKQEVSAAVSQSIRGGAAVELYNRVPLRKGNCCICYEMQVDSLLYRCGHMCTCFKCAHELQWSSGRCPICRAPIVDVVRAYSDS